jgi:serine/threonine-protein kinase
VAASPAPGEASAGAQGVPTRTGTSASPWRTVGIVAAGAGVVALGIGSYFGLEARSKNDQSYAAGGCIGDDCTPGAASIRRDAIAAGNTSTGFFVAGAVLAAGGIALWVLAPSSRTSGGVALTPVAMDRGGGLSVGGGW